MTSKLYNFTGKPESITFTPGKYFIRLSGAQGGRGSLDGKLNLDGGRGAIVSLIAIFKKEVNLFLYIGSKGEDGSTSSPGLRKANGGWNGGGKGGLDTTDDDSSGAGGGGTDIRMINSQDEDGWKSRIAVAAGGSGSAAYTGGAPGGDMFAYKMNSIENLFGFEKIENKPPIDSQIFQGADGIDDIRGPSSGAGGGYYGGTTVAGAEHEGNVHVGAGATSYIAGINSENDEITEKIKSLGIIIQEWVMIPGFPIIGNAGNGEVYISQLYKYDFSVNLFRMKINLVLNICLFIL